MTTNCGGGQFWDFSDTEAIVLRGNISLLKIIIPGAICFLLWRLYVTNKGDAYQNVSILRLNESPTDNQHADSSYSKISPFTLLLYIITTVMTFNLGRLSVLAYECLRQVLHKLLP
jgi:hypothetical protein